MKCYKLTAIVFILVYSCSQTQKKTKSNTVNPIIAENKIDTTKSYSIFDFSPYVKKYSNKKKQQIIEAAIQTISKENFLSIYYKDLSLSDFYLIDIDRDEDDDIIYSSLSNQYRLTDRNSLEILQNNNNSYKVYSISGYLYATDLFTKNDSLYTLKTIMRPCCDYFYYTFFETKFNCNNWTLAEPKEVATIERKKVKEKI